MAHDEYAPLVTWWLALAFASGMPLWAGFGASWPPVVALHGAAAILALAGAVAHAAAAGSSRRGWVAAFLLGLTAASGFWATETSWGLAHAGSALLLAAATYVHVAGRSGRRIWGTNRQAALALGVAVLAGALWSLVQS